MPGEKGAVSEIPRQDGGSVSYVERRWRRLKRDSGKILKTQLFPAFNPIPGMDLVNSFFKISVWFQPQEYEFSRIYVTGVI